MGLYQNHCKSCGVPCVHRYCDRCGKRRDLTGGLSHKCANCKALDSCGTKKENKHSKCVKCGAMDMCNAARGGLCLDCFAEEWCAAHPVSIDGQTLDSIIKELTNGGKTYAVL